MTDARTKFVDYDARREPKTDRWCCRCQKALKAEQPCRFVYLNDQMEAVHPEDLPARGAVASDYGWNLLGLDCAKKVGLQWSCENASGP